LERAIVGKNVGGCRSKLNRRSVKTPSIRVDPLVRTLSSPYPLDVNGRSITPARRFAIAAIATAVLTGLGVGLFVDAYQRLLEESFRERSTSYVRAFSEGAKRWIEDGDIELLREAARFLLVGSALYVRVENDGTLIVDEKASRVDIDPKPVGDTSSIADASLPDGTPYLDITVPLVGEDGSALGHVRIGIDRSSVAVAARGILLLSAAGGLGFDILLIGVLGWALLGRTREGSPSAIVEAGPLRIDPVRKEVEIGGSPVRLTPKQFALLELLASDPGRVFSEEEILEAVWPDSAYADSKDVKQYVYLLRRRLEEAAPEGKGLIVTVAGFGYRLADRPVEGDLTGK